MPKKRKNALLYKPPSSAHPALVSSPAESSKSSTEPKNSSVNELIQQSRKARGEPKGAAADILVPKSVNSIPFGTHAVQGTAVERLTPREQMAARRRNRNPPGPAPPPSWFTQSGGSNTLQGSRHAPQLLHVKDLGSSRSGLSGATVPLPIPALPGQCLPKPGSLRHQVLCAMVKQWTYVVESYNWLLGVDLHIGLKSELLLYLSRQGTRITASDLRFVLSEETESDPGPERSWEAQSFEQGLTHLTIGPSLGKSITWKDLTDLCTNTANFTASYGDDNFKNSLAAAVETDHIVSETKGPITGLTNGCVGQSGSLSETDLDNSYKIFVTICKPLSSLTHLSLAFCSYPTYPPLISFLAHVPYLTHLSLAHWDPPTDSFEKENIPINGRSTPATDLNFDTNQTALQTLRRLGRAAPRLEWLDLSGPAKWVNALQVEESPPVSTDFDNEDTPNVGNEHTKGDGAYTLRPTIWSSALGSLRTLRVGPCGCGLDKCSVPRALCPRKKARNSDHQILGGRKVRDLLTPQPIPADNKDMNNPSEDDKEWYFIPRDSRNTMKIRYVLALRAEGIRLEHIIRAKRLNSGNVKTLDCKVEMEGSSAGISMKEIEQYVHSLPQHGRPPTTPKNEGHLEDGNNREPRIAPWVRYIADRWMRDEDIGIGWTWEQYRYPGRYF